MEIHDQHNCYGVSRDMTENPIVFECFCVKLRVNTITKTYTEHVTCVYMYKRDVIRFAVPETGYTYML